MYVCVLCPSQAAAVFTYKVVALCWKQREITDEDAGNLISYFNGELSVLDMYVKEINDRKKLDDG
jgi:hypothetical protein